MKAYIDSSIVLRLVLGQPDQLGEWPEITFGVSSALLEVECLRTLDRLQVGGYLDAEDAVVRREAVFRILESLRIVDLSPAVLHRAAQPMPAPLGTLDAIHLAAADLWREENGDVLIATHDRALALAARASGFHVAGV